MRQNFVVVLLSLLSFSTLAGAQASPGAGKIRVCVAPFENRATRPVTLQVQVTRLVDDLNKAKPGKKDRDRRPIAATALDSKSGAELLERRCEFVVRTTLVELRESGDRRSPLPGSISIGRDRVENEPGTFIRSDILRRATLDFDIRRVGGDSIAAASASDEQYMAEDALVGLLIDRVSVRTNSAVRQ
ncbi:MAG TPA: hypothetical protein VFU86_22405 [Terriglobales bacterium]|nr:hypothetical protein [Terriglobales bacterium]